MLRRPGIRACSLRAQILPRQVRCLTHVRRESTSPNQPLARATLEAGANEGIVYFSNVNPIDFNWFIRASLASTSPEEYLERARKKGFLKINLDKIFRKALRGDENTQLLDVIPRLRDGGALVHFQCPDNAAVLDVESKLQKYMEKHCPRPWWNPFVKTKVSVAQGSPAVDDLNRFPSRTLRVEFVSPGEEGSGSAAVEPSQSSLFSLFRPYGRLLEIRPQPADSKEAPRYALLDFASVEGAIQGKNCMHNFTWKRPNSADVVAKLKISYQRSEKANWVFNWLSKHPRIVVPLIAGLVATITVAIFDPIRIASIKAHISHQFDVSDNKAYQWVASQTSTILSFVKHKRDEAAALETVWRDRRQDVEKLQKWLMESGDTFIVVQGPRGSGKRQLVVDHGLKNRKNKIVIDCKKIADARGDSATINAAANEVCYRPVFSWLNSISGLLDVAAQSAAGIKTGFSETLDGQINKILRNTSQALQRLALEGRNKRDKDYHLPEGEYLEAHPEKRPVVVIDNFLFKSQDKDRNGSFVSEKLAEWASDLIDQNIAHVIFLTSDVSFSRSLSNALPDRVFRQISLGDLQPDAAKRFILSNLDIDAEEASHAKGERDKKPSETRHDLSELDTCITSLGGRLTDLDFLARRIRVGETPQMAVNEIIEQSAHEILKMYLLPSSNADDPGNRQWTPQQAWILIKELAKAANNRAISNGSSSNDGNDLPSILYNALLENAAFSSSEPSLSALEATDLISIRALHGRPHSIVPGKPVFLPAFQGLASDKGLAARMDISILNEKLKKEQQGIRDAEEELRLLGEVSGGLRDGWVGGAVGGERAMLKERVWYLLEGLKGSQRAVEGLEREIAGLKGVLGRDG
ncbi:MAG: mitochondrial escape protein 2 [Alyxoria varia]|nr:MAG: mitochondrial escape protein 2 [Alyxoria varia]